MLTHVVLFKFAERQAEDVAKARQLLLDLLGRVPTLRSMEVGVDVVHSPRSFDLALIARFDSLEDMRAYQVHPAHQEVAAFLQSVAIQTAAVDFPSLAERVSRP